MSFQRDSDITYDSFVQQNLCRLCWIPISGENWLKSEHTSNDLYEKVLEFLGIDLHENTVPNRICDQCVQKLETFSDYKTACSIANEKLRFILEKHQNRSTLLDEIKPEPECSEFIETIEDDLKIERKSLEIEKKVEKPKSSCSYKAKKTSTYCNICHADLKTKEEFWRHNSKEHGIENNGTIFKCFGCEKRFGTRKARLGHERNFCQGLSNGYKCTICDKYLQTRGIYERHIRIHKSNETKEISTPGFNCRQCGNNYDIKSELDTHKLLHHTPDKRNYICEQCGQIFHRQDYLRKHRMIHGNIKNYACSLCDYSTRQKSSLIVHLRRHTGERPFSCDLCDLKCISSSNLLAHRRRHLGVKHFECTLCSKRFGYKTSLEDHLVSIHGQGDPINRHRCEICGAIFPRIRGLKRHMKAKHKILDDAEKDSLQEKVASQQFCV